MAKPDVKIDPETGLQLLRRQGGGKISFHLITHQNHPTKFNDRSDDLKGLILDTISNRDHSHSQAMRKVAEYFGREICTNTQCMIENEEKFVIPMTEYDENATSLTRTMKEKRSRVMSNKSKPLS